MKDKVMGALEKFAKAMVQPLMYLSAAGILIVVGVLLTNSTITGLLPFLKWGPIQMFGQTLYNAVMAIINNLSVVFVIGLPAALAKNDKHRAALIGFMTYLMYLVSSNTLLSLTGGLAEEQPMLGLFGTGQAKILGIQCVDMGVFGGIILGCIVGYVFNRTFQKRFKGAMQIYSGANFSFMCPDHQCGLARSTGLDQRPGRRHQGDGGLRAVPLRVPGAVPPAHRPAPPGLYAVPILRPGRCADNGRYGNCRRLPHCHGRDEHAGRAVL